MKGGFSPTLIFYSSLCFLGEAEKPVEGLCQGWEQDTDFSPDKC